MGKRLSVCGAESAGCPDQLELLLHRRPGCWLQTSLLCQVHPKFKGGGRDKGKEEEKETPTSNTLPATAGHSLPWSQKSVWGGGGLEPEATQDRCGKALRGGSGISLQVGQPQTTPGTTALRRKGSLCDFLLGSLDCQFQKTVGHTHRLGTRTESRGV